MNDKTKAPSFLGLITESESLSLKDFSGKYLVLYFYPRDMTSGCTLESQDFRDHYKIFQKNNVNKAIMFVDTENNKRKLITSSNKNIINEMQNTEWVGKRINFSEDQLV